MQGTDYIAELYQQVAFIASVLGGFTASFLGTLLGIGSDRKTTTWAVGFSAFAAVLFITATFASTVIALYSPTPAVSELGNTADWPSFLRRTKAIGDVAFFIGTYALLAGIGLSGWARSRAAGLATSAAAATGALALTVILAGVF